MFEIPMTEARARLAELANRAAYADEPIVLTRHGKPFVALVSTAALARLNTLPPTETGPASEHRVGVGAASEVQPLRQAAAAYEPPPEEPGRRPSW